MHIKSKQPEGPEGPEGPEEPGGLIIMMCTVAGQPANGGQGQLSKLLWPLPQAGPALISPHRSRLAGPRPCINSCTGPLI